MGLQDPSSVLVAITQYPLILMPWTRHPPRPVSGVPIAPMAPHRASPVARIGRRHGLHGPHRASSMARMTRMARIGRPRGPHRASRSHQHRQPRQPHQRPQRRAADTPAHDHEGFCTLFWYKTLRDHENRSPVRIHAGLLAGREGILECCCSARRCGGRLSARDHGHTARRGIRNHGSRRSCRPGRRRSPSKAAATRRAPVIRERRRQPEGRRSPGKAPATQIPWVAARPRGMEAPGARWCLRHPDEVPPRGA